MPIEEKHLKKISDKAKKLDFGLLLTGFMILSKDLAEYLTINAYFSSQVQLFQAAYFSTLDENRDFGKWYAPNLYIPIRQTKYPYGFAEKAMDKTIEERKKFDDLSVLCKPDLIKNKECAYCNCIGWELFKRFKILLKPVLCKENGPIQQLENGDITSTQFTTELAKCILKDCFGTQFYWYPIAVYIACLFSQTDYQSYCNPPKSPKEIPAEAEATENPNSLTTVAGNTLLATTTATTELKADN